MTTSHTPVNTSAADRFARRITAHAERVPETGEVNPTLPIGPWAVRDEPVDADFGQQ